MRVIITGGTGLIGKALAQSLVADGHEVVILSRNPKKYEGLTPAGITLAQWDGKTAAGWGQLADGAGAIINLAGENLAGSGFWPARWTPESKARIMDSRVNAGKAVVEAVEQAAQKPQVLIQASASGYYQNDQNGKRGATVMTEDQPPGTDFQAEVVKAWEDSTAAVEAMGVRRVIIRTAVVLSLEKGAFRNLVWPFKVMQLSGPLGSGKQWFPWIHLDDEVAAIRFLMDNENASGAYNLSAPDMTTNAQFTNVLGKVMRRPAFMPVPAIAMKIAFGEVSTLVLDGWQAVSDKLQAAGYEFKYPTAESAIRDLLGK